MGLASGPPGREFDQSRSAGWAPRANRRLTWTNPLLPGMSCGRSRRRFPKTCAVDIIIVGSLAAGYQLLRDSGQVMRTKDVDGMLAPHARAMVSATHVTDRLLGEGWEPQATPAYDLPGTADTRDERLAVVRLHPP